jgi:hypothetical protein
MKPFFIEIPNFWAWADEFWGIWGIFFGQTTSTHFGTVSSSPCFPLFNRCFYKKTVFISTAQILISDWDLNLGCQELGI